MMKLNFKNKRILSVGLALFAGALSSFAQGLDDEAAYLSEDELYGESLGTSMEVSDPLERVNRFTFHVNDFIYMNVVEPVADGYEWITPEPVQTGASNFFRNLRYPIRLAGNLLQGRFKGAWIETGRFAVNSTVGLAGVLDPAETVAGLQAIPSEDVGQAFGSWGIGEGPYLVLPILGPSNVRDLFGLVGNAAVHPLQEPFSMIDSWNWEWKLGLSASEFISESPALVRRYEQMKGSAIDPYGSLKNSYFQFRRAAIEE